MCLVNPHTQTKKEIAEHLKIPIEQTAKILEDLVQIGLASQEGDRFIGNYDRIHLPADSPLISKHHTNWRMRTIHSLDFQRKQDLHYSLVMSISRTAAEKMREILLRSIREMEPVMKEAKDEEVFALTLDLFDVRG
jgi:predicted transcriptional regulator